MMGMKKERERGKGGREGRRKVRESSHSVEGLMKDDGRLGLHSVPHDQVDEEVQQRIRLLRKILRRIRHRSLLRFDGRRRCSVPPSSSSRRRSQRIRRVAVELGSMSGEDLSCYELFWCRRVGIGESGDGGEGGFCGFGREEFGRVGEARIGLEFGDHV